jgi:hypothetical protein
VVHPPTAYEGGRQLKPLLSMPGPHRPVRMILRPSSLMDADRSTLSFDPEALDRRLSTGDPIEAYL